MRRFLFATLALAYLAGFVPAQTGAGQGKAQPAKPGVPGQANLGGITQRPWFQDSAIQRELRINEQQLQRMQQAYGDIYGRFQDRFAGLKSLDDAKRAEQLRELSRSFGTEFQKSTVGILSEQQMQRFNQLNLQRQGLDVFFDPQLQKQLNLTDQQLQQLRKFDEAFDRDFQGLSREAAAAEEAQRRFDALIRQRNEQINSIMNPQQRTTFQQMIGQPFNFPAPTFRPPPPQK